MPVWEYEVRLRVAYGTVRMHRLCFSSPLKNSIRATMYSSAISSPVVTEWLSSSRISVVDSLFLLVFVYFSLFEGLGNSRWKSLKIPRAPPEHKLQIEGQIILLWPKEKKGKKTYNEWSNKSQLNTRKCWFSTYTYICAVESVVYIP